MQDKTRGTVLLSTDFADRRTVPLVLVCLSPYGAFRMTGTFCIFVFELIRSLRECHGNGVFLVAARSDRLNGKLSGLTDPDL